MASGWGSIFLLSEYLGARLLEQNRWLSTAESCTGGGIGYAITHVPGSSRWYRGGVNAYANEVKQELLGVDQRTLTENGAVSVPVVELMARGVASRLATELAIATSGIAGPDGGTPEKPVGTVCFGWFMQGVIYSETQYFSGDRESVRLQSIEFALTTLLERL